MRYTRLRVAAACVAVLLLGFMAGRFSKDEAVEAQGVVQSDQGFAHANVFTASADGSRLYVWTLEPAVEPKDQPVPHCLGFVDAAPGAAGLPQLPPLPVVPPLRVVPRVRR